MDRVRMVKRVGVLEHGTMGKVLGVLVKMFGD